MHLDSERKGSKCARKATTIAAANRGKLPTPLCPAAAAAMQALLAFTCYPFERMRQESLSSIRAFHFRESEAAG